MVIHNIILWLSSYEESYVWFTCCIPMWLGRLQRCRYRKDSYWPWAETGGNQQLLKPLSNVHDHPLKPPKKHRSMVDLYGFILIYDVYGWFIVVTYVATPSSYTAVHHQQQATINIGKLQQQWESQLFWWSVALLGALTLATMYSRLFNPRLRIQPAARTAGIRVPVSNLWVVQPVMQVLAKQYFTVSARR